MATEEGVTGRQNVGERNLWDENVFIIRMEYSMLVPYQTDSDQSCADVSDDNPNVFDEPTIQ